jgi:hypothetical protein
MRAWMAIVVFLISIQLLSGNEGGEATPDLYQAARLETPYNGVKQFGVTWPKARVVVMEGQWIVRLQRKSEQFCRKIEFRQHRQLFT